MKNTGLNYIMIMIMYKMKNTGCMIGNYINLFGDHSKRMVPR